MNILLILSVLGLITLIGGIFIYGIIVKPISDWHMLSFFLWVAIIGCTISHISYHITSPMEYQDEEHLYYIESLGNAKYISGNFTLGFGSIEDIDYYFFFVKTKYGSKRIKIDVDITYIVETNTRKPECVRVLRKYNDSDSFWKVLFDVELHNKIYVPYGTIIREFKVR
jgi:hypothetical protein